MPLNTLRLNQKHLHPNERITFIKPLPDLSTTKRAERFLEKVAAICYPIMKAHSLSITTLEEFPPNREFMGRNFNGGEVIQLVLRRMPVRRWDQSRQGFVSRSDLGENGVVVRGNQARLDPHSTDFVAERDGQDDGWLSMRAVQAVMMHELAHCIEMNHSKAFWKVRNIYMDHLKILWQRGYTGEGVWGRGQLLDDGTFERGDGGGANGFEDVCGGAYRGRGRGRKRGKKEKAKVTYAERKQRKLEKTEGKFGKGQSVGDNEHVKVMLEGKYNGTKPKVAGSKRGRDLRAAAALARFEKDKVEKEKAQQQQLIDEDETESGSGSETESESEGTRLLDAAGKQIKDAKGNGLYKVCEETDTKRDEDAKDELDELDGLVDYKEYTEPEEAATSRSRTMTIAKPKPSSEKAQDLGSDGKLIPVDIESSVEVPSIVTQNDCDRGKGCPICSLENEPGSATCMACAHVIGNAKQKTVGLGATSMLATQG
ncbi:hypothetical protein CAC42_1029 [Sphaceloma murrayae]|uniref:WLM domain-containing protein n=1 Tax=Sphaceloma murrayae TaxID=2082308 RepID=A0A2K1R1W4_9PEZI|nr:hypothetical protein CAC42_1029 [Sphaceloma murrayae]